MMDVCDYMASNGSRFWCEAFDGSLEGEEFPPWHPGCFITELSTVLQLTEGAGRNLATRSQLRRRE